MNKRVIGWIAGFSFVLILVGGVTAWCRGRVHDATGQVRVGAVTRTYLLHVPARYDKAKSMPLVLVFHGGGGRGANMPRFTGFDKLADSEGFIAVYPDGIDHHWNDGRENDDPAVDDVAFVSALLDQLESSYNIDRKRIFATGISNGGFFSQRLACDLSNRIAAVASVAATMPAELMKRAAPSRPVSVMLIDGTADPLVPYEGGTVGAELGGVGRGGTAASAPDTIAFWARRDRCSAKPVVEDLPDRDPADGVRVRRETHAGGADGTEVVLYTVEGGGHTWPGGVQYLPKRLIGKTSHDIDATEVIWEFFARHPMT